MPGFELTELMPTNIKPNRLDLADAARTMDFDVSDFDEVVIQASLVSGSWSSTIVTAYRSIDGFTFTTFGSSVTFTGDSISSAIDTQNVRFLRLKVTDDGTGLVDFAVKGWKQP